MSKNIDKGEIVYCNLKFKYKNKVHELSEVVYKKTDGFFYNRRLLEPLSVKEKVMVYDIEIIKRLGFENKSKEFTEVKRNQEQRNKITGTYE